MREQLSIGYIDEICYLRAQEIAHHLQLPLDNHALHQLLVTRDRLVLKLPNFLPLYADFSWDKWKKRRNAGKIQGLVQACKPGRGVQILDVTAGWGRDAAILASFGADVVMLERNPIMGVLILDALSQKDAQAQKRLNLVLVQEDALDFLSRLEKEKYPDVIYFDPMHPQRTKSALVKKEMQALQWLIGADDDAHILLKFARAHVRQRLVVKWPHQLPPLIPPTFSIKGKMVRFDVYLPN